MTDDGRVVVQGIRLLKDEKAVLNIPDREDAVVMSLKVEAVNALE